MQTHNTASFYFHIAQQRLQQSFKLGESIGDLRSLVCHVSGVLNRVAVSLLSMQSSHKIFLKRRRDQLHIFVAKNVKTHRPAFGLITAVHHLSLTLLLAAVTQRAACRNATLTLTTTSSGHSYHLLAAVTDQQRSMRGQFIHSTPRIYRFHSFYGSCINYWMRLSMQLILSIQLL